MQSKPTSGARNLFFHHGKNAEKNPLVAPVNNPALVTRTQETFAENRLIGRGVAGDDIKKNFHEELKILFGKERSDREADTVDYVRLRAVSASLMLPNIPMAMFSHYGFLFDADATTVRLLATEDVFTMPVESADGKLWGQIDSSTGIYSSNPKRPWLPPTVAELAAEMKKKYAQEAAEAPASSTPFMTERNELKMNAFKEGLIGLYIQYTKDRDDEIMLDNALASHQITPEFIDIVRAPMKRFMLELQSEIKKFYGVDLPVFVWDKNGQIQPLQPNAADIKKILMQCDLVENKKANYEWLKNASLPDLKSYLTAANDEERSAFLNMRNYDLDGDTPLTYLIKCNQIDKAIMLVNEFHADVNIKNLCNVSPFSLAVSKDTPLLRAIQASAQFDQSQLNNAAKVAAEAGLVENTLLLLDLGVAPYIWGEVELLTVATASKPLPDSSLDVLKERLVETIGDWFELASHNDRLFLNADGSIEVCFAKKQDADKYNTYFKNATRSEDPEFGLNIVKLTDQHDINTFFQSLRTRELPEPVASLSKRI